MLALADVYRYWNDGINMKLAIWSHDQIRYENLRKMSLDLVAGPVAELEGILGIFFSPKCHSLPKCLFGKCLTDCALWWVWDLRSVYLVPEGEHDEP
jgi:hypothetical protein